MRVVIAGNGILGLSIAVEVLRRHAAAHITLVAPADRPGSASMAAAAMLNCFAEVKSHAPHSVRERAKFALARTAADLWRGYLSDLAAAFAFTGKVPAPHFGTHVIGTDLSALRTCLQEYNEPYTEVTAAGLPGYLPRAVITAASAIFLPREGWVQPHAVLNMLQQILSAHPRVQWLDAAVQAISVSGARVTAYVLEKQPPVNADYYIYCPGARFSEILAASALGWDLPQVRFGNGITLELSPPHPLAGCLRTRTGAWDLYALPYQRDSILIGATEYITDSAVTEACAAEVQNLLTAAAEHLNRHYASSPIRRVNFGWRPVSADGFPIIGRTHAENFLVAGGTHRDGFHLAPVIAKHIAGLLDGTAYLADHFAYFSPLRALH